MIGRWTVVNAALTLIILALGAQIARTWMRTLPMSEPEVAASPEDAEPPGRRSGRARRARSGDAGTVVAAITDKNLFDPTRKTAADGESAAAVDEEPVAPPGFTIVGVRLIGGDAEAVVEDSTKGKEHRRVRAGDAIGDYTVDEIRATSVVLSSAAGQSVTLWLNVGAGGAPPPAARGAGRARRATPGAAGAAASRRRRQATRRAAQRKERAARRQGASKNRLPQGVRERLEKLRKDR